MAGKKVKQQPKRFQVVVLSAPDPEAIGEVVSKRTGRPLEYCIRMVKSAPAVVATDMDGLYAEDMVGMIKARGGDAEKRLILSSQLCLFHENQPGKALCQICSKIICSICIKEADGTAICPDCSGESKKIKIPFPWARLIVFLLIIGAGAYGYLMLNKKRDPWMWERPFKLAVVGVYEEFQNVKSLALAKDFFQDPGQEYNDLRTHTLPDMAGWFQREYERYGGELDPAIELTFDNPVIKSMKHPPDPPPVDMKFFDRFFEYRGFKKFFEGLAANEEYDLSGYDGVIWIHFVEAKQFEQFTESWSSRNDNMSVVKCYTNPGTIETNIMIVLHEFAHLVGAEDHYDPESGFPTNPEGLVEPFSETPYAQNYGELMAGRIPGSEGQADLVRALMNLRLGLYTAYEMGLVDEAPDAGIR